ncbi:MAG TPA: SDR family NAD(P)-dependent oxidoreductase [Solirubrobacteraceae bacterium]|jgi:3-oxoacyl-[acyl-carrier protein] reductase|nr:SDR family NAD(P)-dependent oxidoreductase [Solirubrobacteraceae bacterium]
MSLDGLRVVVTGSTRGLGRAFAADLARRGARVVVNGVDPERCAATAADLGAVARAGSVADEAVARGLVQTCVEHHGGIDAVVNNAGIVRDAMFKRMTAGALDEVIAVHLRGTFLVTQAAVQAMGEGLSVVNVTSGTALYGLVGQSNYGAAKGGINALTRALTVELGRRGVRVNSLYPRARTDMTVGVAEHPGIAAHLGDAEAVAPLVSYLVSPASAHVAGQVLAFDGRELTVWTHPAPAASERRDGPWSLEDVQAMLADEAKLEPLHPDAIGIASWEAFRR